MPLPLTYPLSAGLQGSTRKKFLLVRDFCRLDEDTGHLILLECLNSAFQLTRILRDEADQATVFARLWSEPMFGAHRGRDSLYEKMRRFYVNLQRAELQKLMRQTEIREIKRKADASEAMVQEICRDIRALDVAKKNLTNTINVLARLKTLSSAVEDLRANSTRRDYEKAAPIFEAAIAMFAHFTEYRDMPKVSELATAVEKIRDELRCVRRGAARRGACWRPPAIPPHPPPCPPQPALQRGRDRGL